jgi:hypothetical protein
MSDQYFALVNGPSGIDELAGDLAHLFGHGLVVSEDCGSPLYRTDVLRVSVTMYENDDVLIDDQGIEFEKYSYIIDFSPYSMAWNLELWTDPHYDKHLETMALFIARALSSKYSSEAIVVRELQQLIGTFSDGRQLDGPIL